MPPKFARWLLNSARSEAQIDRSAEHLAHGQGQADPVQLVERTISPFRVTMPHGDLSQIDSLWKLCKTDEQT